MKKYILLMSILLCTIALVACAASGAVKERFENAQAASSEQESDPDSESKSDLQSEAESEAAISDSQDTPAAQDDTILPEETAEPSPDASADQQAGNEEKKTQQSGAEKEDQSDADVQQGAPAEQPTFEGDGFICAYSISGERYLRDCGKSADLSDLGADEYYSFCADVTYNGASVLDVESLYVVVDGGDKWHWGAMALEPGSRIFLHIYYSNMSGCQTPGSHSVTWYINDEAILSESFYISKSIDWSNKFDMPTAAQIADYTNPNNSRAPYIAGWLSIPDGQRYTEYSVDFKAEYLPTGTYCCLGNWKMDYSSLLNQYVSVRTEYDSVQAYAGFQKTGSGEMVSIMSFWDIFCTDASGRETVIRAQLVYPQGYGGDDDFTVEGTGAHCLIPYEWQADHWYRMYLRCRVSEETGNTVVEQWVCDLDTGIWTLLCAYDVGVKDACFIGPTAIFLENYLTAVAGEIRSLEVCNAMYLNADTGRWIYIDEAYLSPNGGLPYYEGSYSFGAEGGSFWMITSGVGGDCYGNGTGQRGGYYRVDI